MTGEARAGRLVQCAHEVREILIFELQVLEHVLGLQIDEMYNLFFSFLYKWVITHLQCKSNPQGQESVTP